MDGTDYRFEYNPGVIRQGRGSVGDLGDELDRQGWETALVVCGQTVGKTAGVIDPIEVGLGDRLASIFAETTPEKQLATAIKGVEKLRELSADVIVAVGGGSSIDVANVVSLLAGADRDPTAIAEEFERTETISSPDGSVVPVVAIPTTLAGADLSMIAGITANPSNGLVSEHVSGGIWDERVMPAALFYDADLLETTPRSILTASAMNGFDKGIETVYGRKATPLTDGTAIRGLRLLRDSLPTLKHDPDLWATEDILSGIVLVQYGISRPDGSTLSLIHSFGHALKAAGNVQQGTAHAIVAPHALEYLFDQVDGRRDLLAEAFDVPTADRSREALADDVVAAVRSVRDGMDLPRQLRSVEGITRSDLESIARETKQDSLMAECPPGLDPTVSELCAVLDAAW